MAFFAIVLCSEVEGRLRREEDAMWRVLIVGICLFLNSAAAFAQWPDRPVRIIVAFPPGGGSDTVARVLANKLGETFSQRFFVENKPGASGMIGAQVVAKAEPDGYTLMVGSPAEIALNQALFPEMTYDAERDLAPITLLAWTPLAIAAHPTFEAANISDFLKLVQARQIDFSTPGIGSAMHLTGEYINKLLSAKLVHIPYRGAAPAVADAVAGQVKVTIAGLPPLVPFFESGALKAIAVTSKNRSPKFPDVPAMAETPGFEDFDFTNWFGFFARAGTPTPILERLHKAAVDALRDARVQEVLKTQAAEPVGNTPAEFRQFIRAEAARYGKIVQLTGIKVK